MRTGVQPCRSWRIVQVLDDNQPRKSGFYGCGYLSEQNELVVAFRGSEMLGDKRYENDYQSDFALAYATKTPQQKMVDEYFRRFTRLSSRPFTLAGHSLGGNLAAYGAVCAPERARQNLISQYRRAAHCVHVHTVRASAHDSRRYVYSNFVFANDGQTFTPQGTDKKDVVCTLVHDFSCMFLTLHDGLKETICKLLLDAIYTAQPQIKRTQFALEEMTRLLSLWHTADTGGGGLPMVSAAFAAKQMQLQLKTPQETYNALAASAGQGPADMGNVALLLLGMMQHLCGGHASDPAVSLATKY